MTPQEAFEFFKTGKARGALVGGLIGAGAGAGLQLRRLRKQDGQTAQQRRLLTEIKKQKIELQDHPSEGNKQKLKFLAKRLEIATYFAKHPAMATTGSAALGGTVGALVGHRIGQMKFPRFFKRRR
jgi:hypothetical protein